MPLLHLTLPALKHFDKLKLLKLVFSLFLFLFQMVMTFHRLDTAKHLKYNRCIEKKSKNKFYRSIQGKVMHNLFFSLVQQVVCQHPCNFIQEYSEALVLQMMACQLCACLWSCVCFGVGHGTALRATRQQWPWDCVLSANRLVSCVNNHSFWAGTGSCTCKRCIFYILHGCLVTNSLQNSYETGLVILK